METKVDNLETKTDRIETNVSALQENVSSLNAKVDRIETKTDKIEEDVDIIKNVNLATIIEAQQRTNEKIDETRKELSDKIDKYIKSNEVEHKKFDYKISRLELGLGVAEDTEKYNLES